MAITTSTVSKLSKPRSFAKCALSVICRIEERQVRFWGCGWGGMLSSRWRSKSRLTLLGSLTWEKSDWLVSLLSCTHI